MFNTIQSHILIVEDEDWLLNSIHFLLRSKGYQVKKANTGIEALQIVNQCKCGGNPINLLITDIQMPEMNGETLIRKVREFDSYMPILVMTGFGTKELFERIIRLGCNDYIDKPFGLDQIVASVELVLSQVKKNETERI